MIKLTSDFSPQVHPGDAEDVVEAEVLVLGAGMAGITVAQRLKEEGFSNVFNFCFKILKNLFNFLDAKRLLAFIPVSEWVSE